MDSLSRFEFLSGPQRLPLLKPPFGSLVAIDMNSGEHLWRVPVGNGYRSNPAISHLKTEKSLPWQHIVLFEKKKKK